MHSELLPTHTQSGETSDRTPLEPSGIRVAMGKKALWSALDAAARNKQSWTKGAVQFEVSRQAGAPQEQALWDALDASAADAESWNRGWKTAKSVLMLAENFEEAAPLHGISDLQAVVTEHPDMFHRERQGDNAGQRIMDTHEVRRKLELSLEDDQYSAVTQLLQASEFSPREGLVVKGHSFMVSDVFKKDDRLYAVAYHFEGESNRLSPRMFYRSQSDGGWRSSPGWMRDGRHIAKGTDHMNIDEYGQYVQNTKIDENLVAFLENKISSQGSVLEVRDKNLFASALSVHEAKSGGYNTFAQEMNYEKVMGYGLDGYIAGKGMKADREQGRAMLRHMTLPEGFEPNFTADPLRVYTTTHSLAGSIAVEVYSAQLNGRNVEWHVAHDVEKRVWVDRIQYANSAITSYGTRSEVILAGALSAKPFEYESQCHGLEQPRDMKFFQSPYCDVTPLLMQMRPLRHYLEAKEFKY